MGCYGKWEASPLRSHSWIQAASAASPRSRLKKRSGEGGGLQPLNVPTLKQYLIGCKFMVHPTMKDQEVQAYSIKGRKAQTSLRRVKVVHFYLGEWTTLS